MLALAPRSRAYRALLPDRRSTEGERGRRRTRRRPLPTIMALAVVAVLPALALVAQGTEAERTGYVILGLRQQVEVLAAENAQLLATTSALRAPDRIERIARADLGMLTPRPQQVAALAVPAPALAAAGVPSLTVWDPFAAWFVRSEAAAAEPSQSVGGRHPAPR